jgi:hypothetical protein
MNTAKIEHAHDAMNTAKYERGGNPMGAANP